MPSAAALREYFSGTVSTFVDSLTDHLVPTVSADTASQSSPEPDQEEEEQEEEEEDPEDPAPSIREACAESKCVKYKHHFDHCQERVQEGKGQKGEDCVEEMFHLMHCVDGCAVPQVFSKLV